MEKPKEQFRLFHLFLIMKQHFKFILLFVCILTATNINATSDGNIEQKDFFIENTNHKKILGNSDDDDNNSPYFRISVGSKIESITASSIYVIGQCNYETNIPNEVVLSHAITLYKDVYDAANLIAQIDSQECKFTGLTPNTLYWMAYTVTVITDGNETYRHIVPVNTEELILTTSQPNVSDNGNVILSAKTNIDDAETNIGFEWRCTDWSDDYASNIGEAYLYNGTMEGCILDLDMDKQWKFRPYYISNSGDYYYGDWVGLAPTGIESINSEPSEREPATAVARYNMNGQLIAAPQKGVNILRMSDGSTRKVYIK